MYPKESRSLSSTQRTSDRENGFKEDADNLMRRVTFQLGDVPPKLTGQFDWQQLTQVLLFVAIVGGTILLFVCALLFLT